MQFCDGLCVRYLASLKTTICILACCNSSGINVPRVAEAPQSSIICTLSKSHCKLLLRSCPCCPATDLHQGRRSLKVVLKPEGPLERKVHPFTAHRHGCTTAQESTNEHKYTCSVPIFLSNICIARCWYKLGLQHGVASFCSVQSCLHESHNGSAEACGRLAVSP